MPYQHHSPEEKLWAAKIFTETKQSAKEVAAQLNMTCSTTTNQIYAWARKYRQDGEEAFKEIRELLLQKGLPISRKV